MIYSLINFSYDKKLKKRIINYEIIADTAQVEAFDIQKIEKGTLSGVFESLTSRPKKDLPVLMEHEDITAFAGTSNDNTIIVTIISEPEIIVKVPFLIDTRKNKSKKSSRKQNEDAGTQDLDKEQQNETSQDNDDYEYKA